MMTVIIVEKHASPRGDCATAARQLYIVKISKIAFETNEQRTGNNVFTMRRRRSRRNFILCKSVDYLLLLLLYVLLLARKT